MHFSACMRSAIRNDRINHRSSALLRLSMFTFQRSSRRWDARWHVNLLTYDENVSRFAVSIIRQRGRAAWFDILIIITGTIDLARQNMADRSSELIKRTFRWEFRRRAKRKKERKKKKRKEERKIERKSRSSFLRLVSERRDATTEIRD